MPRNIESGPVQEEPEQQTNLEGENNGNDNQREKSVAEKLAELNKLIIEARRGNYARQEEDQKESEVVKSVVWRPKEMLY